ncbi:MAG: peptidylprolyl isomerase [Planctomycetales bacterium]|nr:peptidylprolyl isomerase [Planctomycetales bacterium]
MFKLQLRRPADERRLPVKRTLAAERLEAREMLHGSDVLPEVTLSTNVGDITLAMRSDVAPQTVENFLNYVEDGDYTDMFFHRSVAGFVLQGGGFTSSPAKLCDTGCGLGDVNPDQFGIIPTDAPVVNEFNLSNVRGTVAMAKLGGDPDSATSQFFFNLSDNSANLDNQNGGFTVFAQVANMTVVDDIATRSFADLSSIFSPSSPLQAVTNAPLDITDQEISLIVVESITGNAVLHGTLYEDDNNNGILDETEVGLAGETVYVDANGDGALNAGELTAVTETDGSYHLRVSPGAHEIRIAPSATLDELIPTGLDPEGKIAVDVRIGEDVLGLDVGFQTPDAIINGVIYLDADGDGTKANSEGGIPGVRVYVDQNDNGVLDANEQSDVSDVGGLVTLPVAGGQNVIRIVSEPLVDFVQTGVDAEGRLVVVATVGQVQNVAIGNQYVGISWQNPLDATDVNGVNGTTPLDALAIANELTDRVFSDAENGGLLPVLTEPLPSGPRFFDVNGNDRVDPIDALLVVNQLSTNAAQAMLSAAAMTVNERPPVAALSSAAIIDATLDIRTDGDASFVEFAAVRQVFAATHVTLPAAPSTRAGVSSALDRRNIARRRVAESTGSGLAEPPASAWVGWVRDRSVPRQIVVEDLTEPGRPAK